MLAVGLSSILCGYAYTGGPWPLGYRGWGDILVFVFFGLVAVAVTYFVQAGQVTRYALLAGVPMGLLAANILLVNNYRDVETDAAAGKRTLVVRLGRSFARLQHAASLAVAFVIPFVFYFAGFGPWSLLPLLAAPIAFSHLRRLAHGQGPGDYIALLGSTGKLIGLYAVLFAAGLVLDVSQKPSLDLRRELRLQGRLGHQADDLLDHLASLEKKHGRNGANAVLGGDLLVLVDVHLGDRELAVEFDRRAPPASARSPCRGRTRAPRNRRGAAWRLSRRRP